MSKIVRTLANAQHLEILNQGAHAWDSWRIKNPRIRPDLSRAQINGRDLRGISFDRVNLSRAFLTGMNLRDANLESANLKQAILMRTDLEQAVMSNADLEQVHLSSVNLAHSSLDGNPVPRYKCKHGHLIQRSCLQLRPKQGS